MQGIEEPGADVRRAIDREVALLQSAVDLVSSGVARSTTVVGLRVLEAAVEIVGPRARERGVAIEPLWGPGEQVTDVRVRSDDPA